ncbi:MAG: hypothetical protein MK212_06020 [Saprospiraceae bacterium]|nr:hypothetical protein [Saprospiraceae bacterium]
MKKTYKLVLLLTILNINLNAQDDIKSCEYWFIEDFSEDLLVAYHENCEKHVYTRSGKKILGIKDAYTMLEKVEEAENLYKTVRYVMNVNSEFDPRYFQETEVEQYWWYYNGQLNPIKSKNTKEVQLAGKPYYLVNLGTVLELKNEKMETIFRLEGKREYRTLSRYNENWFEGIRFRMKAKGAYFWVIDANELDDDENKKVKVYDTKGKLVFELWAHDLFMITGGYWAAVLSDGKEYLLDDNYKVAPSTAYQTYDATVLCEYEEEHPVLYYIDYAEESWRVEGTNDINIEGTDSCFVAVTVPTPKSLYGYWKGIVNLETKKEVLPCIYHNMSIADSNLIVLEKDLGNKGEKKDHKCAIYQLNSNGATAISDFEFDMIDILNPRFAVVEKDGSYFLYNIKKKKISKVGFNKIRCTDKIHVYLGRFGQWCLFNTEQGEFEYGLDEIEQPYEQHGYWLFENYDQELWMTEGLDKRYKREKMSNRTLIFGDYGEYGNSALFEDTDFTPHMIDPDAPFNIYAANNREIKVSLAFDSRMYIYEEYLLYKNEKGFHLIDTSGQYLFQNKLWKEAGLLNSMIGADDKSLYCLYESEKGKIAILDVLANKVIYDDLSTLKVMFGAGENGLERGKRHKDIIVYDEKRDQLNIVPNLYDEVLDIIQDKEGNYAFLIRLGAERFWVDSQGYYKSACLNY